MKHNLINSYDNNMHSNIIGMSTPPSIVPYKNSTVILNIVIHIVLQRRAFQQIHISALGKSAKSKGANREQQA